MRFVYHTDAGAESLTLEGERFAHIFKVRRSRVDELVFCNLIDQNLYTYHVDTLTRNAARCSLTSSSPHPSDERAVSIAWSLVDPKTIEKTLPFLNEMGLGKLIFVYGKFSQKNFKPDYERLRRILINSCEQCGRTTLMRLEEYADMREFLGAYPGAGVVDFCPRTIDEALRAPNPPATWLIGPEGGFSAQERELITSSGLPKAGFPTQNILRSETATIALAAKLLV
jgi:16S rRNA (uracil1498-N3)-methyltransferase